MPLPTNLPTGTNYIYPPPQQRQFQPPYVQRSPVLLRSAPVIPMPLSTGSSYELWPQPVRVPWRPQDPTTQLQDIPFPLMVKQFLPDTIQRRAPVFTQPQVSRTQWRPQDPSNYEGTWQPLLTVVTAPFLTPVAPIAWPSPIRVQSRPQDQSTALQDIPFPIFNAQSAPSYPPNNQDIWPLPITVQWRAQDPSVVEGTWQPLLTPAVQPFSTPFLQTDWPVPKNPFINLQTWTTLNLSVGTFPTSTPFVQSDWPTPQRAQLRAAFVQPNVTVNLVPPVQPPFATPFVQSSWPVPGQARFAQPAPQFPTANIPSVQPTFAQPFVQTSWPAPIQPVQNWGWIGQGIITVQQATGGPFSQFNWPVPQGAIYPTSLRTWISSTIELLNPTPVQQVVIPFVQTDWPVPRPAVRAVPWTVPYNLTLLNPQAAAFLTPFAQSNWPVPQQVRSTPVQTPSYNQAFIFIPPFLTLPPGAQAFTPPTRQLPTYQQQNLNWPTALTIPSPPPPVGGTFEWLARARRRGRR